MNDTFASMLYHQLELQRNSFKVDPTDLNDVERVAYINPMALALVVEVGEALQEVSWKPWASGQYFNREAYLGELIDALHFWMNLALVATNSPTEIVEAYFNKAAINAKRQAEGYTGLEKCRSCGREL